MPLLLHVSSPFIYDVRFPYAISVLLAYHNVIDLSVRFPVWDSSCCCV